MKTQLFVAIAMALILGACQMVPPVVPIDWPASTQSNFVAGENGPKNLVLVLDGSGSMVEEIDQAREAIKTYIHSLPRNISVGLVTFDHNGIRKVTDLTPDRDLLIWGTEQVVPGGLTPLAEAVAIGYNMLGERSQQLDGVGDYHLVIVTDGEADSKDRLADYVDMIVAQSPVRIFSIGFQIGEGHSLNRGSANFRIRYVAADNTEELGKGLEKVLAEAPIEE